jgi:hypothetical protein
MSHSHRRTDQSATQTLDVECPTCQEWTRCVVQYGVYDGILTPCVNDCHLDSDYPLSELEARAVTAALVERYDHEWGARDLCGYTEGRR